jgi:hypothetical protein
MYFPCEGLKINPNKNPYSYSLLRKILEQKRMNIGKSNEDKLSIQTLIDACANYPKYEDVMSSNRGVGKRIIEPFVRDMEALEKVFSWEYINCTDPKNYFEFVSATVRVHWIFYPDMSKLKARKATRKKRKLSTKQRNTNGGSG